MSPDRFKHIFESGRKRPKEKFSNKRTYNSGRNIDGEIV